MINVILDSRLGAIECTKRLKKCYEKTAEDEKLAQEEIEHVGKCFCDIVAKPEYIPIAKSIGKLLGDHLKVDDSKRAILCSMSSQVSDALECYHKSKTIKAVAITGAIVGAVILVGITGGVGELFKIGSGYVGPAVSKVIGGVKTGLFGAAGTALFNWVRSTWDDANDHYNVGSLKIADVAVKERLINYGNLLSQFGGQMLVNPDDLKKDNICVMMLDDRLQIIDTSGDRLKLYQRYPNRGAFCDFKYFKDALVEVAPKFGEYKVRGIDVFAHCRQILGRLACLIESSDYKEMEHLNDFIKGKPRPRAIACATFESESESVGEPSCTAVEAKSAEVIIKGECVDGVKYHNTVLHKKVFNPNELKKFDYVMWYNDGLNGSTKRIIDMIKIAKL